MIITQLQSYRLYLFYNKNTKNGGEKRVLGIYL